MTPKEQLASHIEALKAQIAKGEESGGDAAAKDRTRREEIRTQMMVLRQELVGINGRLAKVEPKELTTAKQMLSEAERQMGRITRREASDQRLIDRRQQRDTVRPEGGGAPH